MERNFSLLFMSFNQSCKLLRTGIMSLCHYVIMKGPAHQDVSKGKTREQYLSYICSPFYSSVPKSNHKYIHYTFSSLCFCCLAQPLSEWVLLILLCSLTVILPYTIHFSLFILRAMGQQEWFSSFYPCGTWKWSVESRTKMVPHEQGKWKSNCSSMAPEFWAVRCNYSKRSC